MKKGTNILGATLGSFILSFLAVFVMPSANAAPFSFYDPDHGTCNIFDATDSYYLYECEDGAILYIRRGNGGSSDDPTINESGRGVIRNEA